MKKIYSVLVLALISVQAFSQVASAVIFSEAGEKFTFYLNGEKQNASPQSNVKLNNLTAEFYQARVDFEDATLMDISSNNFAVQKGIEVTYMVRKNKKGEYVLRFHSQTDGPATTASAPASAPSSEIKQIAVVDDEHAIEQSGTVEGGSDVTVTQTTTTTTAKPKSTGNSENVSMNMNIGGLNMGVNVNVQDNMNMDMDVEENSSTTVTTTTTSKTSTTASQPAPRPTPKPEVVVVESTSGCNREMTASSFASAKASIESKAFEDSKMTIAKQVTKANCLTVEQIKQVMALFSFEDSKLDYAKFAYDYCFNQGDYYLVNDAFTFESSIDELNKYIESK